MKRPDASTKGGRLATGGFVAVTLSSFAYFISLGILFPVLPRFVKGPLGGSDTSVGVAVGIFSLSALLLRPMAGRIGDRYGRRLLIVGGAAFAAAAVGAYGLAGSLAVLILLRLGSGAGEAFMFTGTAAAVSDIAPETRRGEAFSLFSLAVFSGLALGPALGEEVLDGWGFGPVWVAAALFSVLAAVLGLGAPSGGSHVPATSGRLIHPKAVIPGIVFASSAFGFGGFSSFIPLYALDIGLAGSGHLFAIYSGIILIVRSFGARIPDKVGVAKMATASLVLSFAGLVFLGTFKTPSGLIAGTAQFALGQSLAFPALLSLVVNRVGAAERASAIGTFTAFLDLSFGLGPVVLGVIAHRFGYPAVFLASSLVAGAGLALFLLARDYASDPATPA
ncbi:MAG: MFS transporter [Actinomycetota bacterium]|nr:MFS transporter [Actinomycetota bacterium]